MALLVLRSQHLTVQSSEQLYKYVWFGEILTSRMVLMCPVRDNFNLPVD